MFASLALLMLLALPGRSGVQPSVVPEGLPGPTPTFASIVGLGAGLPAGPMSLAWSGGRILATDDKGAVFVLDPATGALRAASPPLTSKSKSKKGKKTPPAPPPVLSASALGPAGQLTALLADTVWVYDPNTGAPRWKVPAGGARTLAWSVDGSAVLGSGNNTLTVWDAATGARLEAPDTRARRFAYAARQQRLLVATDHGLDLYDPTGASHLSSEADLRALVLSADGRRAATAGRKLWIWDLEGKRALAELDVAGADTLAFSPDGARLAVGRTGAKPVEILETATGAHLGEVAASGPVRGLLFSADGAEIWWLSQSALYHASATQQDWVATLPGAGRIVALATNRERIATGTDSGLVSLWSAEGGLLWTGQGEGTARDLRLSDDGQLLAARFNTDQFWNIPGDTASACTPEVLPCTRLGTPNAPGLGLLPPALATAMLQGAWVAPFGDGGVEINGDQLRLWRADGALALALWAGAQGTWARWADGKYFWGAMAPVFTRLGAEPTVLPPRAEATLGAVLPEVSLIDGGPEVALQVLVTNTGPGPAYSVRASWASDPGAAVEGSAEIARLDPGASLPVPVRIAPLHAGAARPQLTITGLYGAPVALGLPVTVAPWPLAVGKVKRKGPNVKVVLTRSGTTPFGPVRVWLAVKGSAGGQSLTTGEAGRLAIWKKGQGPSDPVVFDEMTVTAAETDLAWRLSDRDAQDLRLVLQLPGGAAREFPLSTGK